MLGSRSAWQWSSQPKDSPRGLGRVTRSCIAPPASGTARTSKGGDEATQADEPVGVEIGMDGDDGSTFEPEEDPEGNAG
ncbi:hypothetical protein CFI00_22600 [Nocardioides sp. S5]|nr:hypothetical protein CFI00_22600 [Nocardioides sp. S5]